MRLEVSIEKRLGPFELRVELDQSAGVLVLFGPSGSGKTLTLRSIAGILPPDRGRIAVDGRVLFDTASRVELPPQIRGIGYVPQSYALFPHLTALGNALFAVRQADRAASKSLLERIFAILHLEGLDARMPRELSGGQAQRVALARALMARPSLLLLDEPFSALDEPLREALRADLVTLRQELGIGIVVVTHNLSDLHILGDAVAVYSQGRVLQTGPIQEVFSHPSSETVARLTGARNLLSATLESATTDGCAYAVSGQTIRGPAASRATGEAVQLVLRPEALRLLAGGEPPAADEQALAGRVTEMARHGLHSVAQVALDGDGPTIEVVVPIRWWEQHGPMTACRVAVPRGAVYALD